MFNSLSDKILNVLGTFKKKSVITEKDLKNTLRDLRIALLEADVSIKVVMSFIKNVEEKAIGSNIYNTITPYQMIVKILHQEIINTLSDGSDLLIQKNHTVYMLVGLQGSGKTTSAAKLAYFLKNKHKKRILLASVDTFRMAAYEQLQILASQISVDFFTHDIKSTPLTPNSIDLTLVAVPHSNLAVDKVIASAPIVFDCTGSITGAHHL
jgi:signal recognition particle subunit SRP54